MEPAGELASELVISHDGYFPVPVHVYKEGEIVQHDLYFRYQRRYILFLQKNHQWNKEDSDKLFNFGIRELYVPCQTTLEWHDLMDEKMATFLNEPKMSTSEKAKLIYTSTVSALSEVFKNPYSPETAKRSTGFAKHCIDYLKRDSASFVELFRTSAQNMTEHSHGLHSVAYAVTLAKHLGHTDEKDLLALGIGALLHDIGKAKISRAILDKPGRLDEGEVIQVRKHCEYGVEIVNTFGDLVPDLSRRIILEHHERIDGSGYPKMLRGGHIHIFSQIVGLCDVFDALTSQRVYKPQTSSVASIMEMVQSNPSEFDRTLVVAFIEMMK